jgi:glyoxylase-like metal-dependent hydrolase (beta-lactamase superfamily II)
MKVRILGCSGGIGGRHLRTTSLLVDNDILIDAGTGVGDLAIAELAQIDHVFITHSHLDHLACLPFMVDTVGDMRNRPVIVHATEATLEIIRAHVFNWAIWPDFSVIPSPEKPFMRFLRYGWASIDLDGRKVVPIAGEPHRAGGRLPARFRSMPAWYSPAIPGPAPELWKYVNQIRNLRYLIIEVRLLRS